MKTSRFKQLADETFGESFYDRYKNFIDALDPSGKNGASKLFNDALESGANYEEAAREVFQIIKGLK